MITLPIVLLVVIAIGIGARRRGEPTTSGRWAFVLLAAFAIAFTILAVTPLASGGGGSAVASVLLVGLVVALTLVWVTSRLPRGRTAAWADAHGVELTDVNRSFVEAYVTEGHRLRLVCGFGGVIALGALGRGFGITVPVSGWVWLMGGYLAGVVWSEGWLTRLPEGTRRAASLTPRRVRDHLAGRLRVAQVLAPAVAVGLGVWALVATGSRRPTGYDSDLVTTPTATLRWTVATIAAGVVVVTTGVTVLQRRIITKPRPEAAPDLLRADDAIRAASVHLLSGTSIAIALVCVGSQLRFLAGAGIVDPSRADTGWLVCFLGALVAWRYHGHRSWIVARTPPSAVDAPAFRGSSR